MCRKVGPSSTNSWVAMAVRIEWRRGLVVFVRKSSIGLGKVLGQLKDFGVPDPGDGLV